MNNITVVGTGYVGLANAVLLAQHNLHPSRIVVGDTSGRSSSAAMSSSPIVCTRIWKTSSTRFTRATCSGVMPEAKYTTAT